MLRFRIISVRRKKTAIRYGIQNSPGTSLVKQNAHKKISNSMVIYECFSFQDMKGTQQPDALKTKGNLPEVFGPSQPMGDGSTVHSLQLTEDEEERR